MNKKIKTILVIVSILILLGITNVYAVNGSFSISKSSATIEIGKTMTFSITATNCGGKFSIASSNTSVATVSSNEEWIENGSKEITITAKTSGTTIITITASDVATSDADSVEVTGSKTISITVPEKKEQNNTGDNQKPTNDSSTTTPTTPPTTETKSSEARLKNFGIKPNDFSGFKRDKFEYTTEVPNDVNEVEIYAEKLDDKATVEGAGKVQLKEGNNTFEIKVTAEDKTTTKTYKLTIKRRTAAEEDAANGEARLKTLGIKKYDFKGFDKDNTQYSVQIPENIKEVEVYATAIDSNAQITGTGMITLEEGESTLEIVVIAANGDKKTYSINVIRIDAEETEDTKQPVEEKFGLSKLTITGVTLNPKFDVETYEYKVDLKEDLTSLQIIAEANDKDATVEIAGNENLQDGENVITILVKNDKTDDVATYQIIVNKSVELKEVQMSWLKPSTWGKEEIIKIILVIVLIILIICAIALKINISKESKMAKKVDLPGADELDKAIAEHQELAEEDTNNDEIIEKYEAKANYLEEIAKSRLEEENASNIETEEYEIRPRRKGKHF